MKGMTNALPVLIDASTLATKSDISDMESKTHANATFATKTALTTLQNSVGDAFSQVAVGSDGKSLDFTALDGQVNNVVLPSSGGETWKLSNDDISHYITLDRTNNIAKITEEIILEVLATEDDYQQSGAVFTINYLHLHPFQIGVPATKVENADYWGPWIFNFGISGNTSGVYGVVQVSLGAQVKVVYKTSSSTLSATFVNTENIDAYYPYEVPAESGPPNAYGFTIYRIYKKA